LRVVELNLGGSKKAGAAPISSAFTWCCPLRGTIIPESALKNPQASSEKRLLLLSKELEEATNLFLSKIEELEKLVRLIDE
jgi:hypothetical protein